MDIKKIKKYQKNNLSLIIIAIILLLILLITTYLSINNFSIFDRSPQIPLRPVEEIKKDIKEYNNQSEGNEVEDPMGGYISLIHDQTPYEGENFSLIYNEEDNYFYYYINPDNIEGGNNELDKFLLKYGIPERSLFEGLFQSEYPFPTPSQTNP
jgi:hypothetical protein